MRNQETRRAERDPVQEAVVQTLDRLYGAAMRLTRNRADAEDLVQETVLRALEVAPRLDPDGNIPAYLCRTLGNLFINRHRHHKVARRVGEMAWYGLLDGSTYSSESARIWADPPTHHRHTTISKELEAALEALPERFRAVMILADLLDWTYAEIAEELKIPVGTVMSRLWRARHSTRARLEQNCRTLDSLPVRGGRIA
jgi:RNA polymerase sigma-70 factor (ECF subfamily)